MTADSGPRLDTDLSGAASSQPHPTDIRGSVDLEAFTLPGHDHPALTTRGLREIHDRASPVPLPSFEVP